MYGASLSLVTAGVRAEFSVRARDEYGNSGTLEHGVRFVGRMKTRGVYEVRDNKYTIAYNTGRRVYTASTVTTSTQYDRTVVEQLHSGGLFATYYNGFTTADNTPDSADVIMHSAAVSKAEGLVDWSYAGSNITSVLPPWSGYVARWSGFVRPKYSEDHTFRVTLYREYERVRLWLDNMLLIDQWTSIQSTILDASIMLADLDSVYEVRLEYARSGTSSPQQGLKLQWTTASGGGTRSVVPSEHLHRADALTGMPLTVRVAPGPVCGSTSKISGMTLFTAGAYSGFTVQVRDQYNNAREGVGTSLFISARRAEDLCMTYPSQSSALMLATYTATYPYVRTGMYTLHAEAATAGGLLGVIYSDPEFSVPVSSRLDSSVSFDWDMVSSPSMHMSDGGIFSARWLGYISVPSPGVYTFSMISNSGAKVLISGIQVISYTSGLGGRVAAVSMDARVNYPIEVRYSCAYRPCFVQLRWSNPPLVPDEIIPARYLYAPGPLMSNSPVSFSVRAGPMDASRSTCRGDGLTLATSGGTVTFSIQTRDIFGNVRNSNSDSDRISVKVQVAGNPHAYAQVSRALDGKSLLASYQVHDHMHVYVCVLCVCLSLENVWVAHAHTQTSCVYAHIVCVY